MKLSDGRELSIDLSKVSLEEYRALFEPGHTQAFEDEVISKAVGLTVDELVKLSLLDYFVVCREFFSKARNPLDSPNSQSESILP